MDIERPAVAAQLPGHAVGAVPVRTLLQDLRPQRLKALHGERGGGFRDHNVTPKAQFPRGVGRGQPRVAAGGADHRPGAAGGGVPAQPGHAADLERTRRLVTFKFQPDVLLTDALTKQRCA